MSDDINKDFLEAYASSEYTNETMLNWLRCCLEDGPSPEVIDIVISHIEVLERGKQSWLLRPLDGRVHSDAANRAKEFAVDYIATCRKHGYDAGPMKTVTELYGVTDRTVRNWERGSQPDADLPKKELLKYLEFYAGEYRHG